MESPVIIIVLAVVLALALLGIFYVIAGKSRYEGMTEEEFEAEARRGSPVGSALLEVQGILEPGRKVEYVLQKDKRGEDDSAESSDSPPNGSHQPLADSSG